MYSRTLTTAVLCAVLVAFLVAAALLISSCAYSSADQPMTTPPPLNNADEPMTTSPAFGLAATKGDATLQDFGDRVISYLGGKTDLASVQALVTPSAQEGLAQMLSSLKRPTKFRVMSGAAVGDATTVDNDVLFVGGGSEPAEFTMTITVDVQKETVMIVGIQPGRSALLSLESTTSSLPITTILGKGEQSSSLPIIQLQDQPDRRYLDPIYSSITADGVVLATVTEVLPLRRNPLAEAPGSIGQTGRQPVVYKGYVIQVEKAYGLDTIPKQITVYALGNGTIELDGTTYQVREKYPLDAKPGDRLLLPLVKYTHYGTPDLKADEYWVQANYAAFAVDAFGDCERVTGADIDPETLSEFSLVDLENMVAGQGRPDATTVTAPITTIVDASAAKSPYPVILIQEPRDLELMSAMWSFSSADAVALATVTEVLPLRRNPLYESPETGAQHEIQSVVYKGYVLQVEKAYGPGSFPKQITVYALGNGTVELDGVTYEVREKYPLDAKPGDKLLLPLVKQAYFGTPALRADEYWVQANWTAWAVDTGGTCRRVTAIDTESPNEFPLTELEKMITDQGEKRPSVVQ